MNYDSMTQTQLKNRLTLAESDLRDATNETLLKKYPWLAGNAPYLNEIIPELKKRIVNGPV